MNNNKCDLSENLILNQGCSQKYNYIENIHVDNNKIRTLEKLRATLITVNGTFPQFVGQQFVSHQLRRLSYCVVIYHEQVYSECLLFVMYVLICKTTFV